MEFTFNSELLEEFKGHTEKLAKIRTEFSAKMEKEFFEIFKPFFEKYDDKVHSIFWPQYTPFFNDGESCEFSVYDFNIQLREKDMNEDEYEDNFPYEGTFIPRNPISKYSKEQLKKVVDEFGEEIVKDWITLNQFLTSIPDDMYEEAFGDHAAIRVTKDGLEVLEHQHD